MSDCFGASWCLHHTETQIENVARCRSTSTQICVEGIINHSQNKRGFVTLDLPHPIWTPQITPYSTYGSCNPSYNRSMRSGSNCCLLLLPSGENAFYPLTCVCSRANLWFLHVSACFCSFAQGPDLPTNGQVLFGRVKQRSTWMACWYKIYAYVCTVCTYVSCIIILFIGDWTF